MEIAQKLLNFKYQILIGVTLVAAVSSLIILSPSFLTILAYFWPLLLSTVLFLIAVVFFGKTSAPPGSDSGAENAGEGLLNYVAGQPELAFDSYRSE
ncbi:hypothetical protein SLE2022_019550 [Rubroshorea leprosula]